MLRVLSGTHKPKCQDNGEFEARRSCDRIQLPAKPHLGKAGDEVKELGQVIKQADSRRQRIKKQALQVDEMAKLAAFKYEEAETKLPCRLGFETYCNERLREAKKAQVAARAAAHNATLAINAANERIQLLKDAQLAIVRKYDTVHRVQGGLVDRLDQVPARLHTSLQDMVYLTSADT